MLRRINKTALIVFFIFLVWFLLRWVFAPSQNLSSDPFEVITSAKYLMETGKYLVPGVGHPDLAIHYDFAGWPVGFSLLLSVLFKVFGYGEMLARLFTIGLTSLVIILAGVIAHLLFRNRHITWLSALLVALNPLLVAFSGRIHTENGGLFFLFASMTLLLWSVMDRGNLSFVSPKAIFRDKKRLFSFLLSVSLAAFCLTIRETYVIYGLAFVYILYKSNFFFNKNGAYLISLGIAPFLLGYSPSLYYNYINYGSFIVSTHLQWAGGMPLDIQYFFFGNSGSMGLPGGVIILFCFLIYAFPIILLAFIKKIGGNIKFLLLLLLLALLPVLFVYGAFPNPSAVPRYLLPLIPIASIISAYALVNIRAMKRIFYIIIIAAVSLPQLFLFFPLPQSFAISPRIGALAMYSPVYNNYSYNNFPNYVNVMVDWVKNNTESNAVIITPSRVYHFYYYAERDVIAITSYLDTSSLTQIIESRPVYLVEDHEAAVSPEKINAFLESLDGLNLTYEVIDRIPLFSPYIGNTQMEIYRIDRE